MRLVLVLVITAVLTIPSYATLQTTKPHPTFTASDTFVLSIVTDCRADTVVGPETIIALFRRAFSAEIKSRIGQENNHPAVIFEPSPQTNDATRIAITIKGYNITLTSCSLYIDYTITDAVSTFSDTAITTYTIDTKKLHGTYNNKKTAACEQAIVIFIQQFLDTFFAKL